MDLGPEAYIALNRRLVLQLQSLPYDKVDYLHLFLPIAKFMEPDLFPFITWLRVQHPGVKIVVPRVMENGTLEHHLLADGDALAPNRWGIPEPGSAHLGETVPAAKIDRVFVPLLAFDRAGHRLGYGKGFYDRFLQACRKDTLKVGVSLFAAIDEYIASEAHDVKLDMAVCPEEIYRFEV